jgi:uncharacterized beta barrel domain-containing protein DUF5777
VNLTGRVTRYAAGNLFTAPHSDFNRIRSIAHGICFAIQEVTMKCFCLTLLCASIAASAAAQTTAPPPQTPATQAQPADQPAADQPERSDPDVPVNALQPDFTLVALPTTLRVPKGKAAFRITHRFTRALGQGDVGDLFSNFFGFDNGAQIGLELRYGLRSGTQIGIHRTSDRSIQLFGQQSVLNERDGRPVGLDVLLTLEGEENLHHHTQSAIGVVLSRSLAKAGTIYVEPIFVANSNPHVGDPLALPPPGTKIEDDHTFMTGIGARLRVRPSLYVTAEVTPRLAGYDPGVNQISFGIEGRTGGHLFQINFSNGFGTTYGQLARGGVSNDDWYIGFNISRKFF